MSDALMETVVDAVLFFAYTDDGIIDPDVAVRHLEQMASSLQKMSAGEKKAFIAYVKQRAAEARGQDGGQAEAERLEEILPSLGLLPDE